MRLPTHGFTKHGQAVHARTIDHHPDGTRYERFNKRIALWIVNHVGTMTCFWLFNLIALLSLPATLYAASVISFKSTITAAGFILIVSWLAQSYIQLVLLPSIMVGQNLQSAANDARAAKTFEDVEHVIDLLKVDTEGGLKDLYDKLHQDIEKQHP